MVWNENFNRCTDCVYADNGGVLSKRCTLNNTICRKIDECPEGYVVDWDCSEESLLEYERRIEDALLLY